MKKPLHLEQRYIGEKDKLTPFLLHAAFQCAGIILKFRLAIPHMLPEASQIQGQGIFKN